MITRWPSDVTATRRNKITNPGKPGKTGQPRLNNKLRASRKTRAPQPGPAFQERHHQAERAGRRRSLPGRAMLLRRPKAPSPGIGLAARQRLCGCSCSFLASRSPS
jgi:hypothetical protein